MAQRAAKLTWINRGVSKRKQQRFLSEKEAET